MNRPLRLCLGLGAGLLFTSALQAQSVTVLESFEDNVDNVTHRQEEGNRRVDSFLQSDNNDFDQVTHGEKALRVKFDSLRGWQHDFQVLLSVEATAALEAVIETEETGRYFLLYDIAWDKLEADAGWSNSPLQIGGNLYGDQIEWQGGNKTVTMVYDLGPGTPEGFTLQYEGDNADQTFLRFIFNGNTDLPMDVYVDNIRLLDTKPEGAGESTVTVLDGFEESLDSLGVAGGRTEEPVANEDDLYVTEGKKSAKFTMTGDGGWSQDFTIDLEAYPMLVEILEMPQEERLRYTLAWDWIAVLGDGTSAGWFQESVNPSGPGLGLTMGWGSNEGIRTRTINLGLVEWDFPPVLTIIHNSNWNGGDMNVYLDNLRIHDTGAASAAPESFEIASVTRTADGMVSISWPSEEGGSYLIQSTTDFSEWEEIDDGYPADAGDSTTYTETAEEAEKYYRVGIPAE